MTKLHEILAVESDREGYFKKVIPEMTALFKNKASHFQAHIRTLRLLGEETPEKKQSEEAESERLEMVTTVPKELEYLSGIVTNYIDIVYQKDLSNREAKADIIINDVVIAKNIPATTLLGLENKLKQLRDVFKEIPTLAPGQKWELDPNMGKYVYKDLNPEVRSKTKQDFDFKVLYNATDKHPAQIEKWNSNKDIGFFTKIRWSGCLSTADKSVLLGKLDTLIQAIKQARQRANEQEVPQLKIGRDLMSWLFDGII